MLSRCPASGRPIKETELNQIWFINIFNGGDILTSSRRNVAGAASSWLWLLVHLRQLAEERERKLHYLSPVSRGSLPSAVPGALGAGVPVYMSGRYAHPSNQAAVAH